MGTRDAKHPSTSCNCTNNYNIYDVFTVAHQPFQILNFCYYLSKLTDVEILFNCHFDSARKYICKLTVLIFQLQWKNYKYDFKQGNFRFPPIAKLLFSFAKALCGRLQKLELEISQLVEEHLKDFQKERDARARKCEQDCCKNEVKRKRSCSEPTR